MLPLTKNDPSSDREPRPKPALRRTRKEPLSRERITRAALALVQRDGLDALSMPKLARELSAGTMSPYRHVESRDDLVQSMFDHVALSMNHPAEAADPLDDAV